MISDEGWRRRIAQQPPEPILVIDTPAGPKNVWAHHVELSSSTYRNDGSGTNKTTATCRFEGCDFHGRYPTRAHARAVADEHMIRTHVTGVRPCFQPFCDAEAAIKRKAKRVPGA